MLKGLLRGNIKEKRKGKFIVGVCSTHLGAGTTHFSMLLATYFSEWLGLKTAYIDFDQKSGLYEVKSFFLKNKEENASYFTVGRITFYNSENLHRLSEIIGGEADCVILDIGHKILENKNEFLRCDIKVVLSSLTLWQQDKLKEFLESVENFTCKTDWRYVIPFTNEKAIKEGTNKYGINMRQMPYEPEPFTINTTVVHFFDSLLQK